MKYDSSLNLLCRTHSISHSLANEIQIWPNDHDHTTAQVYFFRNTRVFSDVVPELAEFAVDTASWWTTYKNVPWNRVEEFLASHKSDTPIRSRSNKTGR